MVKQCVTVTRDVETGVWCDHCLLPAGVEVSIYADGNLIGKLGGCPDCKTGIFGVVHD
jgi:hypothetical protein